jgi:DNA polymerase-3 subunit epsilon
MINRYAGDCHGCGARVSAGEGTVHREEGRWRTYHPGCRSARSAPPPGDHGGWHRGPLVAFDVETTGPDPQRDRILSAALVHSDGTRQHWLVNPGVPIPAETSRLNGITDEMVRTAGRPPAVALAELGVTIGKYIADGTPVVAFFASYDVTVLHTELARHALPPVAWDRAVIVDPFILHGQAEPGWSGRRTLRDLCAYYGVNLVHAHEAASDAQATLELAVQIAARHPRLAGLAPEVLHEAQIRWFAEDSARLQRWYDSRGIQRTVHTEWPLETRQR